MASGFIRNSNGPPRQMIDAAYINQVRDSLDQRAFNVKDPLFGAKVDGVTDDATAFGLVMTAVNDVSTGECFIPPGTAVLNSAVTPKGTSLRIRGAGMNLTTIKGSASQFFNSSSAFPMESITFEDLTFEVGASQSSIAISINGGHVYGRVLFRRCRFKMVGVTTHCVTVPRVNDVEFDSCVFDNDPNYGGRGPLLTEGGREARFRNCRFLWCRYGFVGDTGSATDFPSDTERFDRIVVEGCTFFGPWWLLPIKGGMANSGGTVTYSATVLTDSAAAFSGIETNATLRIAQSVRSATLTTVDGAEFTDSGATFITAGVKRGYFLRTGAIFAMVAGVESETKIRVEGWWDDTTRRPVAPPAASASYTLYKPLMGRVSSFTATTVTVDRFHDLDGVAATPSAGDRYEVSVDRLLYSGFNIEYAAHVVRVINSTFVGAWADQISVHGGRVVVDGCNISDGQDMGITLDGDWSVIANTVIEHQGASSVWFAGNYLVLHGVLMRGPTPWQNASTTLVPTGVYLSTNYGAGTCRFIRVADSIIDGAGAARSLFGIAIQNVQASGAGVQDAWIESITFVGLATGCVNVYGGANTNIHFRDNDWGGITPVVFNSSGSLTTPDWADGDAVSTDNGDAAKTLMVGSSEKTQRWNTTLTAARAVTLSTTGAVRGAKFRVVREAGATGAFNLNVGTGPLKALTTASTWCEVEYDGAAWRLTANGAL